MNKMMRIYYKPILYVMFLSQSVCVYSISLWDQVRFSALKVNKEYKVSMGSGFFVNSHQIITNRHVVERCKNIAIRGAVSPNLATLQLVDPNLDLALLYTTSTPVKIPYLRINYQQMKRDDILFTVGYPLKNAEIGTYIIRQTSVLDVNTNPQSGFSSIRFTDVVEHGNSGGPLLDKNSNIVGVVTAKISYSKDSDSNIYKSEGLAIGLDGLINFLRSNNIAFASNATYDIFTNYNVDQTAKNYVVNIHCVQEPD
jgi:S1-C subfamily serine protease